MRHTGRDTMEIGSRLRIERIHLPAAVHPLLVGTVIVLAIALGIAAVAFFALQSVAPAPVLLAPLRWY